MTTCIKLPFMLLTFIAGSGTAFSAINGSDDFNNNAKDTTKWGTDAAAGGVLTVASQRLQFTSAGGFAYRPWILNKATYDTNWEVILDVGNTFNFTSGTKEAGTQLLVFATGSDPAGANAKSFTTTLFANYNGTGFKGFLSGQGDSNTEQSASSSSSRQCHSLRHDGQPWHGPLHVPRLQWYCWMMLSNGSVGLGSSQGFR
jgi:hypothetical protein